VRIHGNLDLEKHLHKERIQEEYAENGKLTQKQQGQRPVMFQNQRLSFENGVGDYPIEQPRRW